MIRVLRYYPRALVGDGGMTGAVRRWSEALSRAGARVVIAFAEGPQPPGDHGVDWAPIHHVGAGWSMVPTNFHDALRATDLLVLHSGWTLHNARAAALARKLRVPYLLEPRGAYDPHILRRKPALKRAWWTALERDLVLRARAIHVFFEEERPHLEALGYQGSLVVAPNGVDPADGPTGGQASGDQLLWLGRFDPEHKGLDLLLRGLQLLAPGERPILRLHGPDWRGRKRQVRTMVTDLALQRWTVVGDPVYGSAKVDLLQSARGFVYPSRWDACPNSVLEAVARGIPTLATPYPLARMLEAQGAALVRPATAEALAEGIQDLLSPSAAEVGRRGSQLVRDQLSWDVVARSWLTQVQELL